MTKKVEEVLPEGSVSVESVFQQPDFDRFADQPEIVTWRHYSADALADAEKAEKAATRKAHPKSEG